MDSHIRYIALIIAALFITSCSGGIRAELTFDAHQREGETGIYRWSLFIPVDYPDVFL